MKRSILLFSFIVAAAFGREVARISPTEAAQRVASGTAVLIDVRELDECVESGVAAPAVLLPMSDFDGEQKLWKEFLSKSGDKQLILYCHLGERAEIVATALATRGRKVANAGGFKDWESAGLPVRKVEAKALQNGTCRGCGTDDQR